MLYISVFSGPTSQDECTCGSYKSCNWSQTLIDDLNALPRGSQSWNKRYSYFKDRICDSKSRNVHCCSEKAPDESFLETLKTPTTTIPSMTTPKMSTSPNSLTTKVTTTTADASIAAGQRTSIIHRVEGNNISDFIFKFIKREISDTSLLLLCLSLTHGMVMP